MDLLVLLVKDYEDRHYPISDPDPIEAIKLKLEEKGLKQKDLEHIIGSKGYVSQVLSGKKELTLKMIKGLHRYLGIPVDCRIFPQLSITFVNNNSLAQPSNKPNLRRL